MSSPLTSRLAMKTSEEQAREIAAHLTVTVAKDEEILAAAIDFIKAEAREKALREAATLAYDEDGRFTWAGTDAGVVIRQQVAREISSAILALIPAADAEQQS